MSYKQSMISDWDCKVSSAYPSGPTLCGQSRGFMQNGGEDIRARLGRSRGKGMGRQAKGSIENRQDRAERNGRNTQSAGQQAGSLPGGRKAGGRDDAPQWREENFTRACYAAVNHDHRGIDEIHEAGQRQPDALSRAFQGG